jgi:hypothetical protein
MAHASRKPVDGRRVENQSPVGVPRPGRSPPKAKIMSTTPMYASTSVQATGPAIEPKASDSVPSTAIPVEAGPVISARYNAAGDEDLKRFTSKLNNPPFPGPGDFAVGWADRKGVLIVNTYASRACPVVVDTITTIAPNEIDVGLVDTAAQPTTHQVPGMTPNTSLTYPLRCTYALGWLTMLVRLPSAIVDTAPLFVTIQGMLSRVPARHK